MEIRYRVLAKDENRHAILVRYTTAILDESALDANVQQEYFEIEDGREVRKLRKHLRADGSPWACKADVSLDLPLPAPEGEALHLYILKHAPKEWLEREEALWQIPDGVNTLDHIPVGATHGMTVEDIIAGLKVQAILRGDPPPQQISPVRAV